MDSEDMARLLRAGGVAEAYFVKAIQYLRKHDRESAHLLVHEFELMAYGRGGCADPTCEAHYKSPAIERCK